MLATKFIDTSSDPAAWRKHSSALRRSAELLWDGFVSTLLECAINAKENVKEANFDAAVEAFEITKLLYGLTLETALKGWIVEHFPDKMEIRVVLNGRGEAMQAELRTLGVPTSSGHNLLALAEAAGLFGKQFQTVLNTEEDRSAIRNICRDLAEVVTWRGRYPVPLASFNPVTLDPKVPHLALAHYIRDWLDPVLDALLTSRDSEE